MDWLEKLLEETIAVNAYLFWEKYLRQESRGKDSEEGGPMTQYCDHCEERPSEDIRKLKRR